MAKIRHIKIENLWGIKTISTDFDKNVNIFIGKNGTNKTTFLNLVEATLLLDINTFVNVSFKKIIVQFSSSNIDELIVTRKDLSDENILICYQFDNEPEIDIVCNEIIQSRPYRMARYNRGEREPYLQIKEKLNSIINISWLSVNRDNINSIEFERRNMSDHVRNTIDIKLQELVGELMVYQLQLESEVNKITKEFKEEVLSLMLYNEDYDTYTPDFLDSFENVNINAMQNDLYKAFSAFGVVEDKSIRIKKHIQKITEVISTVSEQKSIEINDVFVLSLIKRTLSIIEISNRHEARTKEIFATMSNLWNCLKKFMPNKRFNFNKENHGELNISLNESTNDTNVPINITSLSSGEKQLFILLTEALLQREEPYLFITDEPELSLHIEWQRIILRELLKLNPKAQLIVATHSPEIAGDFYEKVINMKNIITYE